MTKKKAGDCLPGPVVVSCNCYTTGYHSNSAYCDTLRVSLVLVSYHLAVILSRSPGAIAALRRYVLDKRDSIMAESLLLAAGAVKKNCRVMVYPDGTIGEILACSLACYTPAGWELVSDEASPPPRGSCGDGGDRARRRARRRVEQLIRCNPMLDVFWTATIRPGAVTERGNEIARTDYGAVNRKVQQWLADRVRRRGLMYVAVYEYHEALEADGNRAIHIHGVANHSALRMIESGQRYKDKSGHWHRIYNLPDWTLGYTTAMYMYGSREQAIRYVSKYIYKSERPVGGRWYMHSHNLAEPAFRYFDVDFSALPGRAFAVPDAHCAFKMVPPDAITLIASEGV